MARGSVIQKSGSYYAVYRLDSGKQKWERAGRSKRAAEKLLAKRIDEINHGGFLEIKQILFKDFAQKWLKDYALINVKTSTYIGYETIVRLHLNPDLGDTYLHKITAEQIQELVSKKISKDGLSPKYVINIIIPLKKMFKDAYHWGYIRRDVTAFIKRPRLEYKEMQFLTPTEIRLFLKAVKPDYFVFFLMAVLTGMRRGELIALKWGDVNWVSRQISVNKSLFRGQVISPKTVQSVRRVILSPVLYYVLKQFYERSEKDNSAPIFHNKNGNYYDPANLIRREFLPALKRAGVKRIRFHDLRHSYCAMLIGQGENIKFIQMQMGHSSATVTLDRYGHLMPSNNNEYGCRLDNTVFGDSVRKLLENGNNSIVPL